MENDTTAMTAAAVHEEPFLDAAYLWVIGPYFLSCCLDCTFLIVVEVQLLFSAVISAANCQ